MADVSDDAHEEAEPEAAATNDRESAGHARESDDDDNARGTPDADGALQASQLRQQLDHTWTLYYHDPTNSQWDDSSYTRVMRVQTVGELLAMLLSMQRMAFHHGMFFLMRENIFPTWEDPLNRTGGCWSYKVQAKDVSKVWFEVALHLAMGELSIVEANVLNGISLSPKRGFCIMKIWNQHARYSCAAQCLSRTDGVLNHPNALYKTFAGES